MGISGLAVSRLNFFQGKAMFTRYFRTPNSASIYWPVITYTIVAVIAVVVNRGKAMFTRVFKTPTKAFI